jgi:hypothetical protein
LIKSDHQNLTYWRKPQKINRRQARWFEYLSRFNFKIEHVPGIKLPAADALSRCPDHIPEDDNDNKDVTVLPDKLFIELINTELQNQILESSKYDPDAAKAFKAL